MIDAHAHAALLLRRARLLEDRVVIGLNGFAIGIGTNSQAHFNQLERYFDHWLAGAKEVDREVFAIDGPPPDPGVDFIDWKPEPGKTGRKDAYADIRGGRLILKVRTGMTFLQSEDWAVAVGPCTENNNQVVNFVNAQYINRLRQRGAVICHAAGLVANGHCLGVAGLSGGGKSTLILSMLGEEGVEYLTNDRLLLETTGDSGTILAHGVPKLPRVNPGSILNNPVLRPMLADDRAAELAAMPRAALWELEEKRDVDVATLYGPDKMRSTAKLAGFMVLNWSRDSAAPTAVREICLENRLDILGAVMKSPGPFYQYPDGRFLSDEEPLEADSYLEMLKGVPIYEVSGGVDFSVAAEEGLNRLGRGRHG